MATYVLVHGAWLGGWGWRDVATRLRAAGHEVYRPTLTGIGERAHLAHVDIDLNTHVQDIVNVLFYEDLHEVILVGWSYGGMVITGVAEHVPERLKHLVYLDADVPQDGQSRFDIDTPEGRAYWEGLARTHGDGQYALLTSADAASMVMNVIPDESARPWYVARLEGQVHPLKTFTQPVQLTNPASKGIPRTFISCTVGTFDLYAQMAERARTTSGWRYRELNASHAAPVTHPGEVTHLLLEVA